MNVLLVFSEKVNLFLFKTSTKNIHFEVKTGYSPLIEQVLK